MNRMWEIREGWNPDKRYGMRSAEDKAYECGFEDGYKKAIEDMQKEEFGERRSIRRY